MITLSGKSVFGGIAIGKIAFYKRNEIQIKREPCRRYRTGSVSVLRLQKKKQSHSFRNYMTRPWMTLARANAMIFEIHQMMLEDLDYVESIVNIITFPGS